MDNTEAAHWPNQRRELHSLDDVAAEVGADLTKDDDVTESHHCVLPPIYSFDVTLPTVMSMTQRGLGTTWDCPDCDAHWRVWWSDASQIHGGRAPMSWQRVNV